MVYHFSMAKRKNKEHDFSVTAFRVVQEATGQVQPKPKPKFDAKALGRLGGLKGGKARAEKLSPESDLPPLVVPHLKLELPA